MIYLMSTIVQALWFLLFAMLEKRFPANANIEESRGFVSFVIFANMLFLVWLKFLLFIISSCEFSLFFNEAERSDNFICFYFLYSFANYWWHRLKHKSKFLWLNVHYLHHYPKSMQATVAFLRHPTEVFLNSILIFTLSNILFPFSPEAVFVALVIESILEIFHHSNIRVPSNMQWISYFFQTPEMHMYHHEKKRHKGNYSPLAIYDILFNTYECPKKWNSNIKIGLTKRKDIFRYLFKF